MVRNYSHFYTKAPTLSPLCVFVCTGLFVCLTMESMKKYLLVTAGESLQEQRLTHPAEWSLSMVRVTPSEWHLHWHSFTHSLLSSNKPWPDSKHVHYAALGTPAVVYSNVH